MIAIIKNQKISPKKLRVVARTIAGVSVVRALNQLAFAPQKGAKLLVHALKSAVANAEHNDDADVSMLKIASISIDQAFMLKRYTQKAKGRGAQILKRYSHILIKLKSMEDAEGTK